MLAGGLVFIPQIAKAEQVGEIVAYIFGGYCILLGIILIVCEVILFRYILHNYFFRGLIWILLCFPCFVISLGGLPGVLIFVFGVLYVFSWFRYESGSDAQEEEKPLIQEETTEP